MNSPSLLFPKVLLLGCSVALSACVGKGTHQQVVDERDGLRRELSTLSKSREALEAERLALIAETEALRETSNDLEERVVRLRRERSDLENTLKEREAELEREIQKLSGTYDGLVSDLEAEVSAGQIQIEQLREGLRLNLSQEILFATGSARLNGAGRSVIATVAARLADLEHRVEVQGHTDNVAITGALALRYPSNWELAAARASEVVRLLEREGVGAERMTAVSYGEHYPVAPNDSPEGRARNRRIEIRLLPEPSGR
ncbi:MAG: OmpA family protein [Myxococcales bacterium]|nr:OmpA family protein [Myxococcales bacterium]